MVISGRLIVHAPVDAQIPTCVWGVGVDSALEKGAELQERWLEQMERPRQAVLIQSLYQTYMAERAVPASTGAFEDHP